MGGDGGRKLAASDRKGLGGGEEVGTLLGGEAAEVKSRRGMGGKMGDETGGCSQSQARVYSRTCTQLRD